MLLISKEGETFEVDTTAARASNLVCTLLEENEDEDVPLNALSSDILVHVVRFLQLHQATPLLPISKPLRSTEAAECFRPAPLCTFIEEFTEDKLIELASAANFLDLPPLLDLACAAIALKCRTKSAEELCQFLRLDESQ